MELPLQITARNLDLPPGIDHLIRQQADKLNAFYGRITGCRILVETLRKRRGHDNLLHNVRVDLTLPGGELVVDRQPHADLATAVQNAFDAAQRQLEDYAQRQRGAVKTPEDHPQARVRQLFPYEGYGFLETEDGREIYFHRNSVLHGAFDRLVVDAKVRYVEEEGERGPQASTVTLVGKGRRNVSPS